MERRDITAQRAEALKRNLADRITEMLEHVRLQYPNDDQQARRIAVSIDKLTKLQSEYGNNLYARERIETHIDRLNARLKKLLDIPSDRKKRPL